MKGIRLQRALPVLLTALVFATATAQTQQIFTAPTPIFTDDFNSGPSPLWRNEVGAWVAGGGAYYATQPNNMPNAYSSLPFSLTDFSVDFDVNNVWDGGIFLRMAPAPGTTFGVQGILLNLKVPDGGSRIYWHIFNGNTASPPLNIAYVPYGNNAHVHIEVSGDTYSAFLNGSTTAATTLTASDFSSGQVALYDFSSQSFDNFALAVIPEPASSGLLAAAAAALLISRRTRRQ